MDIDALFLGLAPLMAKYLFFSKKNIENLTT